MKPANNCCGFFTLLFGVEVICLINLIQAIATVALVSSTEVISIGGVKIPPLTQVLYGAWCLIGIPIVINAGLGAVYRVEGQLRFYFYYLSLQLVLTTAYFIAMLFEGDVCSTVVSVDLQRMGWLHGCVRDLLDADQLGFFVYLIYIIWSAAEHVSMSFFPDLVAYKQRLHGQVGQPIAQPVTVKPPAHLMPDIMRSRQQADGLANQAAADFNRISQHVDALGR
eukprot:CAMPEP_0178985220 /NCGR_PEP_ID=MMETSP0795-20121207/2033_1 /TAXON_ID=88552 /ORGANISM="Amoebophrya sp., Strain Ameob2" /LENGTH=223 /DNA_ID=CAMNT_0020676157 /DNA_START=150 /DNA_END=822 /DNA_ORIENTATION=+